MRLAVVLLAAIAAACGNPNAPRGITPATNPGVAVPNTLSPVNNADVDPRPWLTVQNGPRTTAIPPMYRFEVSSTPTFATGVITTTVAEGNPGGAGATQTKALLPAELPLDAQFYWRARSVDPVSGVVGGASQIATFSTFGPRAGFAMLHVWTTTCHSGIGVTIDGALTSDGSTTRFVVPDGFGTPPTLTLEFNRSVGTIVGDGIGRNADELQIAPDKRGASLPLAMTGSMTGTFDGQVAIWDRYHDGGPCSDHFRWVILPPR